MAKGLRVISAGDYGCGQENNIRMVLQMRSGEHPRAGYSVGEERSGSAVEKKKPVPENTGPGF